MLKREQDDLSLSVTFFQNLYDQNPIINKQSNPINNQRSIRDLDALWVLYAWRCCLTAFFLFWKEDAGDAEAAFLVGAGVSFPVTHLKETDRTASSNLLHGSLYLPSPVSRRQWPWRTTHATPFEQKGPLHIAGLHRIPRGLTITPLVRDSEYKYTLASAIYATNSCLLDCYSCVQC